MGNVKVQRAQPNSIYLVLHTNDPVSKMLIIILQALGVQVIFQPWQIVGARGPPKELQESGNVLFGQRYEVKGLKNRRLKVASRTSATSSSSSLNRD